MGGVSSRLRPITIQNTIQEVNRCCAGIKILPRTPLNMIKHLSKTCSKQAGPFIYTQRLHKTERTLRHTNTLPIYLNSPYREGFKFKQVAGRFQPWTKVVRADSVHHLRCCHHRLSAENILRQRSSKPKLRHQRYRRHALTQQLHQSWH